MNRKKIFLLGSTGIQKVLISNKLNTIGMSVIDIPVFESDFDRKNFKRDILKNRRHIILNLLPISGILLILKLNNQEDNLAIEQFLDTFGSSAIKSLMLIFMKSNGEKLLAQNELTTMLSSSNAYEQLVDKNSGKRIPFCCLDVFSRNKNDKNENDFNHILKYIVNTYDEYEFKKTCDSIQNNVNDAENSHNVSKLSYNNANITPNLISEDNIKINEKKKKQVLITGSPSAYWLDFIMKRVFSIQEPIVDSKTEYESDCFHLILAYGLETAAFDINSFRNKCNQLKSTLSAIITIENLNPRPETLSNNMKILERVFSTNELNKHLFFFFTSSQTVKLDELRMAFLQFQEVIRILRLETAQHKSFIKERVHLMNESNNDDLLKILKPFENNQIINLFPNHENKKKLLP